MPVRKPISVLEAALPLLTMLVCLVGGGYFFPTGTELLIFTMFVAAAVEIGGDFTNEDAGITTGFDIRIGVTWPDVIGVTGWFGGGGAE